MNMNDVFYVLFFFFSHTKSSPAGMYFALTAPSQGTSGCQIESV